MENKQKIKNIVKKILKSLWIALGIILLLWVSWLYYLMHTIGNLGVIAVAAVFGYSLIVFILYIITTFVILLINYISRRLK